MPMRLMMTLMMMRRRLESCLIRIAADAYAGFCGTVRPSLIPFNLSQSFPTNPGTGCCILATAAAAAAVAATQKYLKIYSKKHPFRICLKTK
jgi:hypothetical protein